MFCFNFIIAIIIYASKSDKTNIFSIYWELFFIVPLF
nr:MAG TPA: hypothetical protein [Bacteriophage sp.]